MGNGHNFFLLQQASLEKQCEEAQQHHEAVCLEKDATLKSMEEKVRDLQWRTSLKRIDTSEIRTPV